MFLDFSTFDFLLIFLFIVANIVVGFSTRSFVKSYDLYASGNNANFNGLTISATIAALFCSASLVVGGIEQIYTQGLMMIWFYFIAEMIACCFAIFVYIPRIIKIKTYSLHQYIGHFYGSNIRALFALSESIQRIGRFAIQLRLIGKCADYAFDLHGTSNTTIWIAAVILILYASFGGLKAVSHTDVVQFISFFLIVPIIAFLLWEKTGAVYNNHEGFFSIFSGEYEKFTLKGSVNSFITVIVALSILSRTILTTPLNIPSFQRIGMCKNTERAQKLWGISTAIYGIFVLFVVFIGLQLFGITKGINPETNSTMKVNEIVPYMLHFLNNPTISVLFFIMIVSLAISTSDSEFNGIGVLFSNDILVKINKKLYQNKVAATVSGVVACIFALVLALSFDNIFSILLSVQNFFLPVVVIPLACTIFGLRTHKNAIWAGVIAGIFITLLYSFIFGIILNPQWHDFTFSGIFMNTSGSGLIGYIQDMLGVDSSVTISQYTQYAFGPGMLANFLGIMCMHYYYKSKGWKWEGSEFESECALSQEEIIRILDNARKSLVARIKSLARLRKYGVEELDDEEIISRFFVLDFISELPEYQEYKRLIFEYRLKKNFILNDRESDFDPDFRKSICIDCLHYQDKVQYLNKTESSTVCKDNKRKS